MGRRRGGGRLREMSLLLTRALPRSSGLRPMGPRRSSCRGSRPITWRSTGAGTSSLANITGNRIVAVSQSGSLPKLPMSAAPTRQHRRLAAKPLIWSTTSSTGGTLGAAQALTLGQPNKDFTLANNTCQGNLISGSSCSLDVTFRPQTPGFPPWGHPVDRCRRRAACHHISLQRRR